MRTFTAKKIKVVDANGVELLKDEKGNEIKASYKNLALLCLNAPMDGLSSSDMRRRFKVLDKIEDLDPDQSAELTDEEWQTLKECTAKVDEKSAWPSMDRDVVAYVDFINEP